MWTLRVGRMFRLMRSDAAKGVRMLFNTLMLTLPAMGNVAGLLMLLYVELHHRHAASSCCHGALQQH